MACEVARYRSVAKERYEDRRNRFHRIEDICKTSPDVHIQYAYVAEYKAQQHREKHSRRKRNRQLFKRRNERRKITGVDDPLRCETCKIRRRKPRKCERRYQNDDAQYFKNIK